MRFSDRLIKGAMLRSEGIWVGDFPFPAFAGVELKVRKMWSADFTDFFNAGIARGDDAEALQLECIAKFVLVDWRGDGTGEEAYTPEVGLQILEDKEAGSDMRRAINWALLQLEADVSAKIKAAEKN